VSGLHGPHQGTGYHAIDGDLTRDEGLGQRLRLKLPAFGQWALLVSVTTGVTLDRLGVSDDV
jgi:hypothetical protein